MFNLFKEKTVGIEPAIFQIRMGHMATVYGFVEADDSVYNLDIVDGAMNGELAKRNMRKHSNNLTLLLYSGHVFYFSTFELPCKYCSCYFFRPVQ